MDQENYENSIVFLQLFVGLAGCKSPRLSLFLFLQQLEVGKVIIKELVYASFPIKETDWKFQDREGNSN